MYTKNGVSFVTIVTRIGSPESGPPFSGGIITHEYFSAEAGYWAIRVGYWWSIDVLKLPTAKHPFADVSLAFCRRVFLEEEGV